MNEVLILLVVPMLQHQCPLAFLISSLQAQAKMRQELSGEEQAPLLSRPRSIPVTVASQTQKLIQLVFSVLESRQGPGT